MARPAHDPDATEGSEAAEYVEPDPTEDEQAEADASAEDTEDADGEPYEDDIDPDLPEDES